MVDVMLIQHAVYNMQINLFFLKQKETTNSHFSVIGHELEYKYAFV